MPYHLENTEYGVTEPYGIINFDALLWVIILGAIVVCVGFIITTVMLTKPIRGEKHSIYVKRTPYHSRLTFLRTLSALKTQLVNGEVSQEQFATELHDIINMFLRTKTRTDITGYTYSRLRETGAPEPLLDLMNQTYHLTYRKPIPGESRTQSMLNLAVTAEGIIRTWK